VAHEKLQAQGVAFVAKPHLIAPMPNHDLWMAFFHDSEQNLHALMAEMAKIKT
jgi:methylmalonyl-CoA/ethylmalonyl-CoA epimerase